MSNVDIFGLDSLAEISVGYQLRQAVEPNKDGEYSLIQLRNVRDGSLDLTGLTRINLDGKTVRSQVQNGDVLLRSRGATYGAALVRDVPENTLAIAPLFICRVGKPFVTPEYLVWFINRSATQSVLKGLEAGSVIPSVSLRTFGNLEILVPDMHTQGLIVEIDSLAKQERELTERIQKARDQQVATLLDGLLT
ncbi:MAG: restriction endonuclease subunit S [Fibrella sp.]|nr:restriction endonuclease subunit S [Armatimonadota bacterium]